MTGSEAGTILLVIGYAIVFLFAFSNESDED